MKQSIKLRRIIVSAPSENQYIPVRPRYKFFKCVETLPYGQLTCRSPYCAKHVDRYLSHVKAQVNYRPVEPETLLYAVTLPIGQYVPYNLLTKAREQFTKYMREEGLCEYFWRLHYDNGLLNYHLLVKTYVPLDPVTVDTNWRLALWHKAKKLPLDMSSYCEPVKEWQHYTNYLSFGNHADLTLKIPPWKWYRNLYGLTKGYQWM